MRAVLSVLLLLAAGPTWAGWEKVADVGGTAYYIDSASVSDKGNLRRTLVIHDYAQPESGGVRSRRVQYVIDCAAQRIRSLAATEHSEPMAQGKPLSSWEMESDWLYVAPTTGSNLPSRSPYRPIVRFVCSR